MELTIDIATLSSVIDDESTRAHAEMALHGVLTAYRLSMRRHDARLTNAPDAATLACRLGCSWCCYFPVDVRPVEVLSILEFVENTFTTEQRTQIKRAVAANAAQLAGLDDLARARQNLQCPFLIEGRCSIYAVRPQTCRNYHATNAAGCERSFQEPDNLEIDPEFAPLTYQIGGAHVDAFCKVMQDAGYDSRAYELNGALDQAWRDPTATRARFEARQCVFPELTGMEVAFEFIALAKDP